MDWTMTTNDWIEIGLAIALPTFMLYYIPKELGLKPFFWAWIEEDMKRSKKEKEKKMFS